MLLEESDVINIPLYLSLSLSLSLTRAIAESYKRSTFSKLLAIMQGFDVDA